MEVGHKRKLMLEAPIEANRFKPKRQRLSLIENPQVEISQVIEEIEVESLV